jgi:outer membrane lipoprotein-sorting protein
MKRTILCSLFVLLVLGSMAAQTPKNSGDLERVLDDMDKAAASFKSAQSDFVWDQFSKVVSDHDFQKGVIYYRVVGKEVQMAADIREPAKKYVLFLDGKVDVYQPEIEQVTEYNAGKNKSDFESFLVLGFGGRGHDLQKSFDVTYAGDETVDGVKAAKLALVPKTQKVKNMFSQILLWIDPARGISVQQQFIEPSGDYRLAKYADIKLNQKLGDEVFKLKTTGKTKWVRPQG